MNATRKVKLKEINPNLTCILCKGYFIDATTIIECLHSFCKSCIVKHLEKSEYCPACDVQLHTTKPLSSIRSDQMLQEIVYKLVPGLFQNETAKRRKFYKENPESIPSSQEDSGHVYNYSYITSDDIIHLSLEYYTDDTEFRESTKRYIKCPAAVSIAILKKLIYGKFDLDNGAQIDIMYGDRILPDDFLLMDIAYKYSWTHNGNKPLQLCYQVKGIPKSSYLHLVKGKNSGATGVEGKMAAPAVKKRQSRTSTNAAASAITVAANEKSTPAATPNGKVSQRGRRKRKAVDNNEPSAGNDAKKCAKEPQVKNESPLSHPHVSKESISKMESAIKCTATAPISSLSEGKEVQLRISENGVISARSVSSGEEKIILNSVSNTSTNVTSTASVKTTTAASLSPTKMISHLNSNMSNTNISPNISFHPIPNNISTLPSPLDIAVNRANCALSLPPPPILNDKKNNSEVTITPTNNIIKSSSPSAKFNLPPGTKLTPIRKKKEKPNQEKFKDRTTLVSTSTPPPTTKTKVSKKDNTNNQEKCANVKKAMSDLEKKLQTHPRKYAKKGGTQPPTLSSTLFPKDSPLCQPIPIPTQTPENHQHMNGTLKHNSIPTPLLHSLPPGTGLSLVPTTSTSFNDSLHSPNKRFPHHNTLTTASVVNGDLKFTTSPKHLLPSQSPSKDTQNLMGSPSPKKPPKFFKSRHSATSTSPGDGESPNSKSSAGKLPDNKTKMNYLPINGISPKGSAGDSNPNTMNNAIGLPNTTNSTPTTSTAGYGSMGANSQFKYPPNLTNTLNALNMNLNMNNLNMSLAANGVPINLMPFVTSNYCSMPFLNSRNPFNMNMNMSNMNMSNMNMSNMNMSNMNMSNMNMSNMNVPFPFAYPGVSLPSSQPSTIPSSSSSPVNITKPSNPHPVPISIANINSASNSTSSDTLSPINNTMNTLDLSMAKNKPSHEGINGKDLMKLRLITPSPSTGPKNSQGAAVDRNHNKASEFLNIPRVPNLGKSKSSPKPLNPKLNSNSSSPCKSPIKNLEALLLSGGGNQNPPAAKVPERSVEGKPVNKSPGKKDLADIIVNLADQQKKLEKQANSTNNNTNGTNSTNSNTTNVNNSSINNYSAKHLNNISTTKISLLPTTNSSSCESSPNNKTNKNTNNNSIGLNLNISLNGNSAVNPTKANGSNNNNVNVGNTNTNTNTSNAQPAANVASSLSNVSLSPCKSNVSSDNHHNNNNVIESATNGGSESSSCLNVNDSNSNMVVNGSGGNSNTNSNGPLEGLNNLIANSTGSNNTPVSVTPISSSSSTSA